MNMIVNKSDLVGYEAVDRTTAKKEALAKLVAAWESKQAKNAARFGGMGFLAVSLAACNSSTDDDPVVPEVEAPAAPVVTTLNEALATTKTTIATEFTSGNDVLTATEATLTAAHVLVDNSNTDNDTLTVESSTGANTAPQTVVNIETVTLNNNSTGTAANFDVGGIIGSSITINNTANSHLVSNDATVTNVGTGNTVTFGTAVTGTATVTTTTGGADGVSVVGGGAATLVVNLGGTNTSAVVQGGSTAGTTTVNVNSSTTPVVTSGAADTAVTVTNIATSTSVTSSLAGTAAAKASVKVEGTAAVTDAVTVNASGVTTLDTEDGDAAVNTGDQVEGLTLIGNGAAATFELDDGTVGALDAPLTVSLAGTNAVSFQATAAQLELMTSVTGDSTGVTTAIVAGAAINANTDFTTVTTDVIDFATGINATANRTLSFVDAQAIKISADNANPMTLDVNDGSATTTIAAGSLSLDLAVADINGSITVEATDDKITTLNVTASTAQDALNIIDGAATASQALTINLSGAVAVTAAATTEAAHLNASSMTGALTATFDPDLLQITGGSGDDTFNLPATGTDGAFVIAGGAGNDLLVINNANTSLQSATGGDDVEVVDVTAGTTAVNFGANQLHTGTFIFKDTGAGANLKIAAGADMNLSTVNLSGLTFQNAATNIQIGAGDAGATALTLNGTLFNSLQAVNITGSATIDDITGTANADTISGGAGADVLNGAGGADNLDGGAGADTLNGGTGADNITTGAGADTISVAAGDAAAGAAGTASTTGLDTVSDFTAGTVASGGDKIQHGGGASTIAGDNATAVAGTAAIATGTATFHADDDTLAEKITATEAAMTGTTLGQAAMFAHGGAAYVLITDTTDGCTASDVLIALTGIDTTATTSDVLTADGAGGFTIV